MKRLAGVTTLRTINVQAETSIKSLKCKTASPNCSASASYPAAATMTSSAQPTGIAEIRTPLPNH